MRDSRKSNASLTSGVLMSLFSDSKVAASRIARASKTVMICVPQKVCQRAKRCSCLDLACFFTDSILCVCKIPCHADKPWGHKGCSAAEDLCKNPQCNKDPDFLFLSVHCQVQPGRKNRQFKKYPRFSVATSAQDAKSQSR